MEKLFRVPINSSLSFFSNRSADHGRRACRHQRRRLLAPLEHWHAVRSLLTVGRLPSALVVHRAQFEAQVRSVWLVYCACEADIGRLSATLDLESEQAAKNMPAVAGMMTQLQNSAPAAAYDALARFKQHNWQALNSYTHAGLHPLRRHADGYPEALLKAVLCNANGVGVMSCMQAVVLSNAQPVQRQVLEIAARYSRCVPELLDGRGEACG